MSLLYGKDYYTKIIDMVKDSNYEKLAGYASLEENKWKQDYILQKVITTLEAIAILREQNISVLDLDEPAVKLLNYARVQAVNRYEFANNHDMRV